MKNLLLLSALLLTGAVTIQAQESDLAEAITTKYCS